MIPLMVTKSGSNSTMTRMMKVSLTKIQRAPPNPAAGNLHRPLVRGDPKNQVAVAGRAGLRVPERQVVGAVVAATAEARKVAARMEAEKRVLDDPVPVTTNISKRMTLLWLKINMNTEGRRQRRRRGA